MPGESSAGKSGGSSKGDSGSSSGSSSFDEEEALESAAAVTTDNAESSDSYEDENIKITYTQYTTNGTTIHVADVQLSSAEYLKTAFAQDTYGKNVTEATSSIAEAHDAVLAINGDYYGVQEKGYVIRNGVVYRDKAGDSEVLCIYADGSMKIVDPSSVTAQELVDQGVWQAFSFGPGLVEDGEISVSLDSEVGRAKASNPRTAIGIIDDLHYVFVVSDGRTNDSEGVSLYELASFMEQLGVQTAYNLDGGGSSTMVFRNQIINNPTGGFGNREREVSDIVYIG
jgi:exopolysaccharide biosynthesis protein